MSSLKQILERDGFLYGMVVPWFNYNSYGCDIGRNHRSIQCNFDPVQVEEVFYNCKSIGYNCVHIWLFEIMEGISFDINGFALGFDVNFMRNLHTACEIADRNGIDLLITFQPHISYSMSYPDEYKFYTQIIHKPEYTRSFIDNCVIPLARYFALQENVIMLDIYAEPEGDVTGIDGNMQQYGGSWAQMQEYIRSVARTLKEYAPDKPVTIASGWRKYESLKEGRYNGLGLDYIGVDIYNDTGEVESACSLGTGQVPVWLAEFGPEIKDDWDDEFYTKNTLAFYDNARKSGYFGAFHWMYGYASSGESLTMIGKDGRLRPVADSVKSMIFDRINKDSSSNSSGNSSDNSSVKYYGMPPQLLYIRDPLDISWFHADKTKEYILERTEDLMKWEAITRIIPDAANAFSRFNYRDISAVKSRSYYYRVIAVDNDGYESYSRLSNKVTL